VGQWAGHRPAVAYTGCSEKAACSTSKTKAPAAAVAVVRCTDRTPVSHIISWSIHGFDRGDIHVGTPSHFVGGGGVGLRAATFEFCGGAVHGQIENGSMFV